MNDARELVVLTSLSINQLTHLGFSLFAAPTGHISRLDQTALFYWTCSVALRITAFRGRYRH